MKILLERTTDWDYDLIKCEVKEYDSLEACVDEILSNPDLFPDKWDREVVVSKRKSKKFADISYVVEIYNTYRE